MKILTLPIMRVVTAANPKEARLVVKPTARTSAGAQLGG